MKREMMFIDKCLFVKAEFCCYFLYIITAQEDTEPPKMETMSFREIFLMEKDLLDFNQHV